jgi:SAM-dependent methyltransferase
MSQSGEEYDRRYFTNLTGCEQPGSQRLRRRLKELLAHRSRGRLLEIGIGQGGFLRLAARHFDVEGIDVSPYAVGRAKRRFGRRVHQGDILKEELPIRRYDAVAAFNILEHLSRPEAAIANIERSLTEDGILIGSVPNNYPPIGRFHTLLTNLFDRTHVFTPPPSTWQRLFLSQGLSRVTLFGEIVFGRNRSVYVRHRLWPFISFNLMFVCAR